MKTGGLRNSLKVCWQEAEEAAAAGDDVCPRAIAKRDAA